MTWASGELKGTVSSRKVTSGPVISTRSGLEVVMLMSAGIVAGGESLTHFLGRSANIFVDPERTLKTRPFKTEPFMSP